MKAGAMQKRVKITGMLVGKDQRRRDPIWAVYEVESGVSIRRSLVEAVHAHRVDFVSAFRKQTTTMDDT